MVTKQKPTSQKDYSKKFAKKTIEPRNILMPK